jgi:hypothetical protein
MQPPWMATVGLADVHDAYASPRLPAARYRNGLGTVNGPQMPGKPHWKANLNLSPDESQNWEQPRTQGKTRENTGGS